MQGNWGCVEETIRGISRDSLATRSEATRCHQMGDLMSATGISGGVSSVGRAGKPDGQRWWVLGVVGLAQLMIVLDSTR